MTAIEIVLSKIAARQSGPNRWIAKCPGHVDRSPSLSIAALKDGRVLLHCHAGCEVQAVLEAAGLTFSELFDAPLGARLPPVKVGWSARELLELIEHEVNVVMVLAWCVQLGQAISELAADRLHKAADNLAELMRSVRG